MNILLYVFWRTHICISIRYTYEGNCQIRGFLHVFSFNRYCEMIFQNGFTSVSFHQQYVKMPFVPHPCHIWFLFKFNSGYMEPCVVIGFCLVISFKMWESTPLYRRTHDAKAGFGSAEYEFPSLGFLVRKSLSCKTIARNVTHGKPLAQRLCTLAQRLRTQAVLV